MVSKTAESALKNAVVVIVGPTAVGKTDLAIQLAERLEGEIVSADSRLFYRGMDIGTAKPSRAERKRVPHHLIDVADPDQIWSLAMFQNAARGAIKEIQLRNRLPFLVGGSGQYIRAVVKAWDIPHVEPDPSMRRALESWLAEIGADGLHTRLAVLDPRAAERIDSRNTRRTIRAIEVIFHTGRLFSSQSKLGNSRYNLMQIGLNRPRPELYARIDARIQLMFNTGLVDEVQRLLDRGYSSDLPTMSAIGYQEIMQYLNGELSLDEAILKMKRRTRIFVRRQANWFKSDDTSIYWYAMNEGTVQEIGARITAWLRMKGVGV